MSQDGDRTPKAPETFSILLIDDDAALRSVMGTYLEEEGYRVSAARSGEAGLAALSKEAHDIVITDLKMPGMGGLEVVRRVKEKHPDTEVIVITGFATVETGVEATREGAYDFLLKPLKVEHLDSVLQRCTQWIRHKRSHAELQEVNRKLLEVTRLKERFLAVTDHELRTPVTVLDGMLHLLVKQQPDLPEAVRERLDALCQVSRRLVHMVRDIHDIVLSRAQPLAVDREWTTPGALREGVLLDFEMARFSRTLNLEVDDRLAEDYRFQADIHRLRQAVTELIQNAVKATPDGGKVTVTIDRAPSSDGPRLNVTVADDGVGIPLEEQQKIFDIFYGVGEELQHHTSKFDFLGAGLGLGLPIALEIAHAHGGGLEFESAQGRGSAFTLWIPVE